MDQCDFFSIFVLMKGIIFSIEDFAINDGPGIRTTVFLKGCPLRCAWCHNPEGLHPEPQIMHLMERDVVCGEEMEASQLALKLLKDADIFRINGGGVTFTGGEPTMQADFLCEVLELLDGVHKAVETSGYCSERIFRRVLDRVDLVLMDMKMEDDQMHRRYTGVSNRPILRNLEILKESGKPFVIRIPVIPGVNDNIENMEATARLLEGTSSLVRVELMRYHKTAGAKYGMLDMKYDPPFDTEQAPQVFDVFHGVDTLIL